MNKIESLVEETRKMIIDAVERYGIHRASTCDTNLFGWDADLHQAYKSLERRGIPGIILSHSVKFEVIDWVAVKE